MTPKRVLSITTNNSDQVKETIKIPNLKPDANMSDTSVISSYIQVARNVANLSTNTYVSCSVIDTYDVLYV